MRIVAANIDKELIERCVKGDQDAWKDLIIRYERLVYSVALALCTESEASDVFQQVWMELYQRLSNLRHAEALPAWLITVTRRCAYKLINSRHGSEPLEDDVPDLKQQQITQIEYEHELERGLSQLGDRCRQLIDLLYFNPDEPSYAGIADKLSMPVASIGPTRARCLEKLRKLLGAT